MQPGNNDHRTALEVGIIEIVFTSKDSAQYRVDDAPFRDIEPFIYGISASTPFPNSPSFTLPDMTGDWMLRVTLAGFFETTAKTEAGMLVSIGEPVTGTEGTDGTLSISYPISRSGNTAGTILMDELELVSNEVDPRESIGEWCPDARWSRSTTAPAYFCVICGCICL